MFLLSVILFLENKFKKKKTTIHESYSEIEKTNDKQPNFKCAPCVIMAAPSQPVIIGGFVLQLHGISSGGAILE